MHFLFSDYLVQVLRSTKIAKPVTGQPNVSVVQTGITFETNDMHISHLLAYIDRCAHDYIVLL